MRYFYIILSILFVSLLFLYGKLRVTDDELPIFLREDKIAKNHSTIINCKVQSIIKPNNQQVEVLKNDYSNIWAHLNNLYTTNNVEAGKEYYSKYFFLQLCKHHSLLTNSVIKRSDIHHQIAIKNWSTDGLLCTMSDSVKLVYSVDNKQMDTVFISLSSALLYEGDHWRVDALHIEK